jgi:AcrR family transcriptional regulator
MSTSVSRATQKQATRSAIIDAAAWLFARRGIDATSIDAVAARVGLTKGAVYANFESKRELIEAVAEAYSAPADFRPLLRRDLPLSERLRLFGRAVTTLLSGVGAELIQLDFEYRVYAKRNRAWGLKASAATRRGLTALAMEFDEVNPTGRKGPAGARRVLRRADRADAWDHSPAGDRSRCDSAADGRGAVRAARVSLSVARSSGHVQYELDRGGQLVPMGQ